MHSQRGSILVFVTLTVAILMIVGVTFATATTAEYRSAMHHTQGTQAFYIAEAGLNWARRGLGNGSIVLPSIGVGQTHILYRSAAFGTPVGTQVLADIGEIEVAVRRLTASRIELVVQGRQQLARRTLSIQADETAGAGVETALGRHQVNGVVDLGNHAVIRGDISGSSFVLGNHAVIHGARIVGPPLASFAPPTFSLPTDLTSRGTLTVNEHGSASLLGNSSYTDVVVRAHGVLMINVPDANDVVIRVRNLSIREHARLNRTGTGTGRVLLHIEQSLTLSSHAHVNASGHIERMIVYGHGTAGISVSEHASLTGILVTNTAPVTLRSHATLTGHIITGATSVTVDNHAQLTGVLYAPRARVDVGNHGRVDGVVIAGTLYVNNHGQVNIASGGIASFTPSVTALGLWSTATSYSFHTWGSR
jgi:cytoskeletal protein CcmA (bactofilin family)